MAEIECELEKGNYAVLDEHISPTAKAYVISRNSFEEHDALVNESYYEKFILDDFDNYLDEINDRLTVSRLVSDSVIKGMVSAVVEETTEKVSVKDAEIAMLNKKLQTCNYTWDADNKFVPPVMLRDPLRASIVSKSFNWLQVMCSLDKSSGCGLPDYFGKIRNSLERQVQRLMEEFENARRINHHSVANLCSARMEEKLNSLVEIAEYLRVMLDEIFDEISDVFSSMEFLRVEHLWEHELCEDINTIVLQNFLRDVEEEYETKLLTQKELISALRINYQLKISILSAVHEDLDAISMSLSNSDSGLLLTHSNNESFEELNNTKWKDQFPIKAPGDDHSTFTSHSEENGATVMQEPPFLKKLSKEELSSYYITEMTKMRRQHDKAMEEKTDELFRLKREFLKEKGSWVFKKDKELEHLKKNVRKVILKLNDLQAEKEGISVVNHDYDELARLKRKINSLFLENQRLKGILTGKKNEIECLSLQVADAANQHFLHSSLKADLLKQVDKLKEELNDLALIFGVREDLDAIILKEICKHNLCMECAEMKTNFVHEMYSVLFRELASETNSMIDAIVMEQESERALFGAVVSQKEIALLSEISAKNKLMQEMTSLSLLLSEKEKVASEAGSTLTQHMQHFDLVNKELDMLRSNVRMQELIISENNIQLGLIRNQLDETLKHVYLYEAEISNMKQKLFASSRSLEESERERTILQKIIKVKEKELSYLNIHEKKQQLKLLEMFVSSLEVLSRVVTDFESKLTQGIDRIESRLTGFSSQCNLHKQEVILLQKKELWYKRMLERRNSDLQKAEAEVDLLGDEVDALVSLLGKVYVVIDHYSPVLQYYPGVMEVLKLVRRQLQGEAFSSR